MLQSGMSVPVALLPVNPVALGILTDMGFDAMQARKALLVNLYASRAGVCVSVCVRYSMDGWD